MKKETRLLEVRGRRFTLGPRTWLMGVANVTPDSFSDGGRYFDAATAVGPAASSSPPRARISSTSAGKARGPAPCRSLEAEEARRVVPVIAAIRKPTGALISVDTAKAAVARAALEAGADIVNDTSAFRFDPAMAGEVARSGAAVVLMHMQGTPLTMQLAPRYADLLGEVRGFLEDRMSVARAAGIPPERIVVDPCIGFGKSVEDNLELLRRQEVFHSLGRPLLLGFSRKAFLGKILDLPPDDRLEGTIAAAVISVARGAHILRGWSRRRAA